MFAPWLSEQGPPLGRATPLRGPCPCALLMIRYRCPNLRNQTLKDLNSGKRVLVSSLKIRKFYSRCRANMAHIRQSRSDYGIGFQVKVLTPVQVLLFLLGSGPAGRTPFFFFFFITLKPRVEWYAKSYIQARLSQLNRCGVRVWGYSRVRRSSIGVSSFGSCGAVAR